MANKEQLSRELIAFIEEIKRWSSDQVGAKIKRIFTATWKTILYSTAILITAAYLGELDLLKDYLVYLAVAAAVYHSTGIFKKVLPWGVALELLFRISRKGNQDAIAGIPEDFKNAFRVWSWVLASELVVAIVVFFVPFHYQPRYIPLFFIASLGAMFWAIYVTKGQWWVNILATVSVGTILALLFFFVASTSPWVSAEGNELVKWWKSEAVAKKEISPGIQSAAPKEDRLSPRGVTITMGDTETRELLLRPIGIRLLEGKARIECLACDSPNFYLERERKRGNSNVEVIDVEQYYRKHGTRPSVYHTDVFKIRIKADGFLIFKTL